MYLLKEGPIELWGSCHPSDLGCSSEGRPVCSCKYHVVDRGSNTMKSFDSYSVAGTEFESLSQKKVTSFFISNH